MYTYNYSEFECHSVNQILIYNRNLFHPVTKSYLESFEEMGTNSEHESQYDHHGDLFQAVLQLLFKVL